MMHEPDTDEQVVLESVYIDFDPILDGFDGVVIALSRQGSNYTLTEIAVATGNPLLRFSSTDANLAYGLFCKETSAKSN